MCDELCLECDDILQGTALLLSLTLQEGGGVERDLLLFSFCASVADCVVDVVNC